jgi:hypothetical protein
LKQVALPVGIAKSTAIAYSQQAAKFFDEIAPLYIQQPGPRNDAQLQGVGAPSDNRVVVGTAPGADSNSKTGFYSSFPLSSVS